MSYIALYRKYRPDKFESIVGQENVTQILKNQVKNGKISHAYIFSGTRGTGKTSAAKVFARAINCLNPKDGEPCNECEVCKNILEGNTTDVIEMDAASNNSVENIRQIRQEVVYATIDVKYRVYIIDEVHMLTTSAFNALLKTLEEPPQNVVFILATTEQHKIPVTILSRCLRFDFNRIPDKYIIDRLKFVMSNENILYEDKALEYIAKLAEGGLRDALSILDRCVLEKSKELKYEDVLKIVGATQKEIIENTVKNILNFETAKALENVDEVVKSGKDLRQYINQLTESFLQVLLQSDDENEKNRVVNIIDVLSKLDSQIRFTSNPVIVLKSNIVSICNGNIIEKESTKMDMSQSLLNKITALEMKINTLEKMISDDTRATKVTIDKKMTNKKEEPKVVESEDKNKLQKSNSIKEKQISVDKLNVDEFKKNILQAGKLKLYSALAGATIKNNDTNVEILTQNNFAYNILKMQESIDSIKEALIGTYGIQKDVKVELSDTTVEPEKKINNLLSSEGVNYTSLD